jgi:hypothetical protein
MRLEMNYPLKKVGPTIILRECDLKRSKRDCFRKQTQKTLIFFAVEMIKFLALKR